MSDAERPGLARSALTPRFTGLDFSATSLLKQDYKETMTVKEATELCLKVMSKTMDTTKLGSEKRASLLLVPVLSFCACR